MITGFVIYNMSSPPFSCLFFPLTVSERGYVKQSLLAPFQRRTENRGLATTGVETDGPHGVSWVQQFKGLRGVFGIYLDE